MSDPLSSNPPGNYETYFGLAESPFTLTSNPRFLFESSSYLSAINEVDYALSRREPFIVVTGPIGTGKTTLCRMIAERRGPRTVVAIISAPPQTADDLFRQILDGFGLLTDDTKRVVEASHFALLKVFQQFLQTLVVVKAQAILVFDEAQHLRPEILEQVRLLANVDSDQQTLQIVLIGQPELDDLLKRPDLGQVNQRVSRRHRLEPLQPEEVTSYVNSRLAVAQAAEHMVDRATFTPAALRAIAALSRGVPRVINILCDRSLENAREQQTHTIDVPIVRRAATSLNLEVPSVDNIHEPVSPVSAIAASMPSRPTTVAAPAPGVVSEKKAEVVPPWEPQVTRVRVKRSHVPIAAGLLAVGLVVFFWFVRNGSNSARGSNPVGPAQAVRETPPPPASADQRRPSTAAPVEPPSAARSADVVPAPSGDQFVIIVSSFRTQDRAKQVADDIAKLGMPSGVRNASGWQQVVVGPYASRDEAVNGQARLSSAHYADTKITQANR